MEPIKEEVKEEKKEGQEEKEWFGKIFDFFKGIDKKAGNHESTRAARGIFATAGLLTLLERFEEVRADLWVIFCALTGGGYKVGKVVKKEVVDPVMKQAAVYFRVGFVGMLTALIIGVGAFILYFGGLTGQPWYAMLFTLAVVAFLISWGAEQAASVIVPSLTKGGIKWERHIVISVIAVAFFTFFAIMSTGAILQAAIYLLFISVILLIVSAFPLAWVGYFYYKTFFRSAKYKGNPERPTFRHFANIWLLPVVNFLLICCAIFLYAQYFGAWLIPALMVNVIVAIIAMKLAGLTRWWVKLLNNSVIIVGIIFFLATGTAQMFYKAAPPKVQNLLARKASVLYAKASNGVDEEALINRLPGDIDGNGKSDLDDLKLLRKMVEEGLVLPEAIAAWGDVTNDGKVDSLDLKLFETGNDKLFQRPEKLLQKLGLIKKPVVVEVKQQPPDTTKKAVTPQVTAAPPKQEFVERETTLVVLADEAFPISARIVTPSGDLIEFSINDEKGAWGPWKDNSGNFTAHVTYRKDGKMEVRSSGFVTWCDYGGVVVSCGPGGTPWGRLPECNLKFREAKYICPKANIGELVARMGGRVFPVGEFTVI